MNDLERLFPGSSELAQRMRALDWSTTDLGSPERWPESLRTAVRICLTSCVPSAIFWGPNLSILYNDASVSMLGEARHPRYLGRSGRECWGAIWETLGPLLEGVGATGQAAGSEDLPLFLRRKLPREESYFRFTCSPLLAADGRTVEGIFCPVLETTLEVIRARRLETQRRLQAELADLRSVDAVCKAAARVLKENSHDIPFAALYVVDEAGRSAVLAASAGITVGPTLPRTVAVEERELMQRSLASVLCTRHPRDLPDLGALFPPLPGGPWPEPATHAVVLPIAATHASLAGLLLVGVSPRRVFDAEYRNFFELIAAHIGTGIMDAQSAEAARKFLTPPPIRVPEEVDLPPDALSDARVLIADDSTELREYMTRLIAPRWAVQAVPDGEAALHAARQGGFDIIVTDVMMPKLDGFGLLKELHADPLLKEIPVIMLSGRSGEEARIEGLQAGADDYLIKPFGPKELLARVESHLKRARLRRVRSEALRASKVQQSIELEAMTRLHGLSTRLLAAEDLQTALDDVLENAIPASGAEFGNVHLYNPQLGTLQIVSQRGFDPASLEYFRDVRLGDGTSCARALQSGERVIIEDVWHDKEFARHNPAAAAVGFRAVISTPIKSRAGIMLGMLSIHFQNPHRPSERDQRMLDLYARHAADFIERLRSEEAAQRQTERLRLLWEAAAVLLTTGEPDTMLQGLFGKIAPHLGLDVYANYMVNDAGDALHLESFSGLSEEAVCQMARLEIGQGIGGMAAFRRSMVVATHIQESADPMVQVLKSSGLRACVCNPLLAGGRLLGTLSFGSRVREQFDEEELEFLRTICRYVTVAEERLQMVRELRSADRQKNEFLAMLGHELRNPLSPIRNAVIILKKSGTSSERLLGTMCDMIERQVEHLTRLIDDLLDVSRIVQGKIALRSELIDLGTVLSRAVETAQPGIESRGHELTISLPPGRVRLLGDPVRLAQVFANLLHNAAKYTPKGGRIDVEVRRVKGEVLVAVRDNGIGIAKEMLPKVFDLFVQAEHSLDRSQGGLGIGLTLVKRLVVLHGGQVSVKSDGLGRGSEFTVRLSAPSEEEIQAEDDSLAGLAGSEPALPAVRILVVDDNADIAQSMAIMLESLGHDVRVAPDGVCALAEAERHRPQLVLLDIGLPGMNGYQVAERLRRRAEMAGVILVAMTGYGQDEDRRRAQQAGFDEHVVKPVEPTVLMKLLSSAASVCRARPARMPDSRPEVAAAGVSTAK